ncbi:DUF664 domain-containing protein [Epidermidibacterium keratini]|uniref:DUF664 domain-containing protein n=1 Tax=Epidermidibacterium keratini TaxID=1891644 RepID=A0A7L4YLS8_9ACTN|nr:DinB family protein [Epidermidibacterium keratini]QHC00002.1 DUF664 domain-containing protein [Epidermidibacterium keratini]
MTDPDGPAYYDADLATQLNAFIDQHREMLLASLDGLTEAEVRARVVPSKTTLLGLLKHARFVERVWLGEAVTGQSRADLGIEPSPDESFDLTDADTIESVRSAYVAAAEQSRQAARELAPDAMLTGNRRGPITMRWVQLHLLRELAQHCGHADIIREQLLAARDEGPGRG